MEKIYSDDEHIKNLVKQVKTLSLRYRTITNDQTYITVNDNGEFKRVTKEKDFFMSQTKKFRERLRNGESIEDILVEALALCCEAVRRKLNMDPYDVQIEAAIAMLGTKVGKKQINGVDEDAHNGVIAEMKTGEGKTLVQVLIAYLNVLQATKYKDKSKWLSVHVMTSNDALAKRDANLNGQVLNLLGISCGFVPSRRSMKSATKDEYKKYKTDKQKAYKSDVVYAMASTIAFDFLDDNTAYNVSNINISKPLGYAIVDEADDILIDQAINPLRLSGSTSSTSIDTQFKDENEKREIYKWATEFIYGKKGVRKLPLVGKVYDQYLPNMDKRFKEQYAYFKDTGEVILSRALEIEIGHGVIDEKLYYLRCYALIDCILAKEAYKRGREYELNIDPSTKMAEVVLIDQNIGRKKYSSKYSDGIHEAIEAKEQYFEQDSPDAKKRFNISFSIEKIVKAKCTYPDFLLNYEGNACGMTGTSDDKEFLSLYGLSTYRVRTRKKNIRIDEEDELYITKQEKYNAIIREVINCHQKGQPVLIGTSSVQESETISSMLSSLRIRHQLLNANNEEEENEIIKNAGQFGSITVATNMAGRGTDIKLGDGVKELGGLYVIGTSYNISKRVDLQLKGRAARQGDPGKTKFFSSLEDSLIKEYYRRNALEGIIKLYKDKKGPIKNKSLINMARESQKNRELRDKQSRLQTELYNKVFIEHRKIIYDNRKKILYSSTRKFMEIIKKIIAKYVDILVENENLDNIHLLIGHLVNVDQCHSKNKTEFKSNLINSLFTKFGNIFMSDNKNLNSIINSYVENTRNKFLNIIDSYWVEHMKVLENLKVSLSTCVNTDVLREYNLYANRIFAKELIPILYNEMLTYALVPTMNYGDYQIRTINNVEEDNNVVLN